MAETGSSPQQSLTEPADHHTVGALTPDQWSRVREAFAAVRELPPADQLEWLDDRCAGGSWLHDEVASLLRFAPQPVVPQEAELPSRMRKGHLLGRGGFSDVYAVVDAEWGDVAVKRLRIHNPDALLQFKNEFRLVKERLQTSPHVVRLHELIEHQRDWLLLMERLEGETLRDRLDRNPDGLDIPTVNRILAQIMDGLKALHNVEILHRDLKPANVWIRPGDEVVLLDFGLSALVDRLAREPSADLFGTLGYLAPERLEQKEALEVSDWYSVGVILWEMLGGSLPAGGLGHVPLRFSPRVPAALSELCTRLLQHEPEHRAGPEQVEQYLAGAYRAAARPAPSSSGKARLIGREREFRRLQECFRKTTQGQPVCVFLTGDSGTGKTELVEAFLSSVSPSAVALRGRCYEASSVPFQACDALVDELATLLRRMPEDKREARIPRNMQALERVFPVLAGLRGGRDTRQPSKDTEAARDLAFTALRDLVGRFAERDRLVLFIDDLQWGDFDSRLALSGLLSGVDSPVALLILAWRREGRESGLPQWMIENAAKFRAEVVTIDLQPLDVVNSEKLAGALLDDVPAEMVSRLASGIAKASAGNPFLIHELAACERYRRALRETLAATGENEDSLFVALRTRLPVVSREAGAMLDVVAVAGEALPDHVIRLASNVGVSFARAREELIELRLARSVNRGTHADLDIYHARQRMPVQSIRNLDAKKIHGRIAAALIQSGDDPQRVYPYLRVSEDVALRAHYAERAADKAFAQLAFEQASTFYGEALDCTPDQDRTISLYRKLGDSLASAGMGSKAAAAYQRVAALAPKPDDDLRISMKGLAAGQLLTSGQLTDGLAMFREVCREAGVPYPNSKAALIASILWLRLRLKWRGLETTHAAVPTPRQRIQMEICWTGLIGTGLLETTRSAAYSARHLLLALEVGEPRRLCRAVAAEAAIASAASVGSISPHTLLECARKISIQLDSVSDSAFVDAMESIVACNEGDWKPTMAAASRALAKYAEAGTGGGWERVTTSTYWLSARVMLGDWKGVIADLPALVLDAANRGDRYAAVNIQLLSNYFLAEIGAGRCGEVPRRAVELHAQWRQPRFDMQRFCTEMTLLDCELYNGDVRTAWTRFEHAHKEMRRSELASVQILNLRLAYTGARCAIALARVDEGRKQDLLGQAEKFTEWLGGCRVKYGTGLAALMLACIASTRAERENAEAQLKVALEHFHQMGMAPAQAVCEARLAGQVNGAWFAEQRIAEPERLLDSLAPGLWWT